MSTSQVNRSWPDSTPLDVVLKAGAVLSGNNPTENRISNPNGLPDVLRSRLERFDATLDGVSRTRSGELQTLQLETAFASLYVLGRVHAILIIHDAEHGNDSSVPPLIGAKDMAQLRTHLSIVFNWGTEPLFARVLPTLPHKPTRSPRVPPDAQIIDLTVANEELTLLFEIVARLLNIILPDGPLGPSSTTFVAMTVLSRGFSELLRACICLGWLPNELRRDVPSSLYPKTYVSRLLNGSQPAQSITALGSIMRKHARKPLYVPKVCKLLLTEQLVRPAGIAGLLSSVFGEDVSSTEAPLEKLQSTSDVLNTLPPKIPPEEYYPMMIPRMLHLLSPSMDQITPPSHRRAAAFTLSRMLNVNVEAEDNLAPDTRRSVINWCLLDSFQLVSHTNSGDSTAVEVNTETQSALPSEDRMSKVQSIAKSALVLTPSQAVPTLSTILMNTDPSPELIDVLLQPIAPQLYTLFEHLLINPTADPMVRETVDGLLGIWARAAGKGEVVNALWEVVEGHGGEWEVEDSGELRVFQRSKSLPSLTLSQLADLQEGKLGTEESEETNPLSLSPHPLYFAKFLKSMKRDEVASALYLRILDTHLKLDHEVDPLRKLLLFKLSMQISEKVGADAAVDSPLRRPDVTRMLMFIKMSLDQDDALRNGKGQGNEKFSRENLRFVSEGDREAGEGDSDDEDLAPGLEGVSRREHLSVTAVNLLIALLGEHPDLSPRTVPLLNDIYQQLEPLANSESAALRPRAREARITLTARLASFSAFPAKANEPADVGEESPQEKYQRALKLLQDPLLPVRAHGLLLLRELVAPAKPASRKKREKDKAKWDTSATVSMVQGADVCAPTLDAALVPAILSIFMQSIQDEDSYIFMSAVQGLAALVDGFGREVLQGLVNEYAKGLEGVGGSEATVTSREVDLRVRVGEALAQIIRRCGGALGKYVDAIVPRLFALVRASHLPTTLRTSAISLLATAADTNALALNSYSADLISAMVDLVQIESVRSGTKPTDIPETDTDLRNESGGMDADSALSADTSPRSTVRLAQRATRVGDGDGDTSIASQEAEVEVTMDTHPTAANPKFPPLRRAALHFLSLLVRALTARVYENDDVGAAPRGPELNRAVVILGHVSITDSDGVVQVMAREAVEQVQQLRNALLGF